MPDARSDASPLSDESRRVRDVVRDLLASRSRLAPHAVRLACTPLLRDGQACGLHFALAGPRAVLMTAIWDADRQTLWCYDSRGERFHRAKLAGDEGV
ncbi:MAG: hypothetical protein AAF805_14240 [Planctomycetota bacterium]